MKLNKLKISLSVLSFAKNCGNSLLSLAAVLFFARKVTRFTINKSNKDNLVVLGNGPSLMCDLKHLDLTVNVDYLCVNFFANSDEYTLLKPKVYVFLDPWYWKPSVSDNSNTHDADLFFQKIVNLTTWPLVIFAPTEFKRINESKFVSNKNIIIQSFNNIPIQGFNGLVKWALRSRLGFLKAPNVISAGLYYGILQRYSQIILCGANHNWLEGLAVDDDNIVVMRQQHFNEIDGTVDAKPVFLRVDSPSPARLPELLLVMYHVFNNYWILGDLGLKLGVSIVNHTNNSFIDAFKRKK